MKSEPLIFNYINNIYPFKIFEDGKIYHCENSKNYLLNSTDRLLGFHMTV